MFYVMKRKYQYAIPSMRYFEVIKDGFRNWKGSFNLLKNSGIHSIKNHTEKGYKSESWSDKKNINYSYLKEIF